MGITDQLLMAYVDGELSPDLAALILSRMDKEPDLLERLEQHQRLRSQLSAAYGPVMGEPLPPDLAALLAREGVGAGPSRAKAAPSFIFRTFDSSWPMWAAAAAAAVVGVGVSQAMHMNDPLSLSDGRIVASGSLARSLEHNLAADTSASGAKIMASFEDRAGRYCRVFEAAVGGHQGGVACKNDGRWAVVALANTAGSEPSSGYRQAASAMPASVVAAVEELQPSSVLTPEQERQARTQQWRIRAAGASKP
jgi:anti-sigma factor RsiW